MKQREENKASRLAEAIKAGLDEKGVSILELATKTDLSYEHVRGIVRGERVPSRFVLKAICEYLKLPFAKLNEMANTDKMLAKYGDLPLTLAGKTPSLDPLEQVWGDLTSTQQKDLIDMARAWAKRNRPSGGKVA